MKAGSALLHINLILFEMIVYIMNDQEQEKVLDFEQVQIIMIVLTSIKLKTTYNI